MRTFDQALKRVRRNLERMHPAARPRVQGLHEPIALVRAHIEDGAEIRSGKTPDQGSLAVAPERGALILVRGLHKRRQAM